MNKLIAISFLSCLFGCNTYGQLQQKNELKTHSTRFTSLADSIVISKMHEYNIPGLSIGIVKDDSIIHTKGYGIKSIINNEPVNKHSVFHTASISKLFTAIAVIKLTNRPDFSLENKLVDIIPELNYKDRRVEQITIHQLLNHTSGFPDIGDYNWKKNNELDTSLRDYILGKKFALQSDPSSTYAYSNLAYDVLGYVVEKVSGRLFEDYVQENILDASGMKYSDFRYFNIPDFSRTAPHSKQRVSGKIYQRAIYPYTREHAPSSTLNASADDLAMWMISFLQALDNPQSEVDYQKMIEPTFGAYPHIGLGFQLSVLESKKTIGHYGGDRGFRSYLLMVPEEKIGLVLLANCDYHEDFRQEILHPLAKLLMN